MAAISASVRPSASRRALLSRRVRWFVAATITYNVIEAAVVDGASRWRTFINVTVPLLRPTIIFVVITSTIGGLQIFDEPRLFDTFGLGGPDREWMTVTMYLYELGWATQRNLGRSAAVAWLLFLIIVLFAMLNYAITRRIASSDGHPRRIRGQRKAVAR